MALIGTDLKSESGRIAQNLKDQLSARIAESGGLLVGGGVPSPRALAALHIKSVVVSAHDAALILELLDVLDRTYVKALEADHAFLREYARVSAGEGAYRDPRVKGSKAKAAAAVRALGFTAKDPAYWPELYRDYERLAPYGKVDAIQTIADREWRTVGAVLQGLKREISRRRRIGVEVPVTLPRM